ncbi:MAG: carbohydrate kinase family protein [Nitrososphaeraceae archaeon]
MFEGIKNYTSQDSIIVLHDFFIDRIVSIGSKVEFFQAIEEKTKSGGGSIRGVSSLDVKGGNAVNVAYCLASLGVPISLYTTANKIGSSILENTFLKFGKNIDMHLRNGRQGLTTSLEFRSNKSNSNVMISDVGDNHDYGPENISTELDMKILSQCKGVVIANWASNLRGTELLSHVFKNSPHALHFVDPADIESRRNEFKNMLLDLCDEIDVVSINENEYTQLARAIGIPIESVSEREVSRIEKSVRLLAKALGTKIDLHTQKGSIWSDGKDVLYVESFKVKPQISTGAGDSWDAADLFGYLAGLNHYERLLFSNAYASLYIRSPNYEPATKDEVLDFILDFIQSNQNDQIES